MDMTHHFGNLGDLDEGQVLNGLPQENVNSLAILFEIEICFVFYIGEFLF